MIRDARLWTSILVLQILCGFAVFAITRAYYLGESQSPRPATSADTAAMAAAAVTWPAGISEADITGLGTTSPGLPTPTDPVEISRQADEFFATRRYELAAERYRQLLVLGPDNVDVHNNLGLTLHYLGRSVEALRQLDEGVAIDPNYQRIWLTIGFVNSQLGNNEQARAALTNATELGTDESIRQSARNMLETLP